MKAQTYKKNKITVIVCGGKSNLFCFFKKKEEQNEKMCAEKKGVVVLRLDFLVWHHAFGLTSLKEKLGQM